MSLVPLYPFPHFERHASNSWQREFHRKIVPWQGISLGNVSVLSEEFLRRRLGFLSLEKSEGKELVYEIICTCEAGCSWCAKTSFCRLLLLYHVPFIHTTSDMTS